MGRCQGPEPNQRLAPWILHRPLAAAGFCALHVATGPRERRDHEREHRPVKDLPLRTSNDTCKVELKAVVIIGAQSITHSRTNPKSWRRTNLPARSHTSALTITPARRPMSSRPRDHPAGDFATSVNIRAVGRKVGSWPEPGRYAGGADFPSTL